MMTILSLNFPIQRQSKFSVIGELVKFHFGNVSAIIGFPGMDRHQKYVRNCIRGDRAVRESADV
jgi:hypothetical protein